MAKNWREVRAEAMALGRIDPQRVDNARKEIEQLVHIHHLAESTVLQYLGRDSVFISHVGVPFVM